MYGALEKTILYVCEVFGVGCQKVSFDGELVSDEKLVAEFEEVVKALRERGKNPRIAVYDTISSVPGIRMPFELLTDRCRDLGVLSLVDGAHGIGKIKIDMHELNPDFFFSNIHK